MRTAVRATVRAVAAAVLLVILAWTAGAPGPAPIAAQTPPPGEPFTQSLAEGFNTAVFLGEPGTALSAVVAELGPAVESAWVLRDQRFVGFRPGLDPALAGLANQDPPLALAEPLFIRLRPGTQLDWTQVVPDGLPRHADLERGWNLVAYTGDDTADLQILFGGTGCIESVWRFAQPPQRWLGFFPDQPPEISEIDTADPFDSLFVLSRCDEIVTVWFAPMEPEPPPPVLGIELVKSATEPVGADEEITYTYTVTNTGDADLTDVTLIDDVEGPIVLSDTAADGVDVLAPGATETGTAVHLVTIDEVSAGMLTNVAELRAQGPDGEPVSDVASLSLMLPAPPPPPPGPGGGVVIPPPPTGTIVIAKDVTSAGAGAAVDFAFTHDIAAPNAFTLAEGGQQTFAGLPPGTYTVSEDDPAALAGGFRLAALTCDDGASAAPSTVDLPTRTATIQLDRFETVTCTFANEPLGTIVIEKTVAGADGMFTFESSLGAFTIDTSVSTTAVFGSLLPGEYVVQEAALPPTHRLVDITCDDGSVADLALSLATIQLDPGETVTCTFANEELGKIVIAKTVTGADAAFGFDGDLGPFTIDTALAATATFPGLAAGSYVVQESGLPAGYGLRDLSCDDGGSGVPSAVDLATATATIQLDPGETVTCTFTNDELGTIVVAKTVTGADANFGFDGDLGPFTIDTALASTATFPGLLLGAHVVQESGLPAGYGLRDLRCDDGASAVPSTVDLATATATIQLDPGETVTCTFTNEELGTIVIAKTVAGADAAFGFDGDLGPFTIDTALAGTAAFPDLLAGTYVVQESGLPAGYVVTGLTCDDGASAVPSTVDLATATATIQLDLGETVTCTFANEELGTIAIAKTVAGADAAFGFDGDLGPFTIDTALAGTATFPDLFAGAYVMQEVGLPAGYVLTALSCDDGASAVPSTVDLATATATIQLDPGETVTCTFANDELGIITIGATATGPDAAFDFDGDLGVFTLTTVASFAAMDFPALAPGTYLVEELAPPPGAALNDLTCDDGASATPSQPDRVARVATIHLDPGEHVTCNFTNAESGMVIVQALSEPPGGAGFAFTTTIDGSSFTLDDGQAQTFVDVPALTHTLTQTGAPGFALTQLDCAEDGLADTTTDLAAATATLNVQPNETIVCTFHYVALGSVTIAADTVGGDATLGFDGGLGPFSIATTAGVGPPTIFPDVTPGTHVVTLTTLPPGFALLDLTCDDGGSATPSTVDRATATATIELDAGEDVACRFTATDEAAIVIEKVRIGPFPSPAVNFLSPQLGAAPSSEGLTFTIVTENNRGSAVFPSLTPGTYVVEEPQGPPLASSVSRLIGLTCDDGGSPSPSQTDLPTATATIELDPGEVVICRFTNERLAGIAVALKNTVPDDPQDFTFSGSGPDGFDFGGGFTLDADPVSAPPNITSFFVPAGSSTVTMDAVPGWASDLITCLFHSAATDVLARTFTVDLAPGESVQCTFRVMPAARIVVRTDAAGGAPTDDFSYAASFAGGVTFTQQDGGVFDSGDIAAGAYTVGQTATAAGYTLIGQRCVSASGTSVIDDTTNPASIPLLRAGDTVTCTFVNGPAGSIRIEKATFPAGGAGFGFTNTIDGTPFTLDDGQTHTFLAVAPGTYAVTETATPGFLLSDLLCSETAGLDTLTDVATRTATITIETDEVVSCRFTNIADTGAGTINWTVQADGGDGAFGFTGDVGPFTVSTSGGAGVRAFTLPAGTYAFFQGAPATGFGYRSHTCTDANGAIVHDPARGFIIALEIAEVVDCTFTYASQTTIELVQVAPGAVPDVAYTGDLGPFTLADRETRTFNVSPGTFVVTQEPHPTHLLSSLVCDDFAGVDSVADAASRTATIVVEAGELVRCGFVNHLPGVVRIRAASHPAGLGPFTFPNTILGQAFLLADGETREFTLPSGSYTVSQNPLAGSALTGLTCAESDDPNTAISLAERSARIRLEPQETVECTFTNTADGTVVAPASLTVIVDSNLGNPADVAFSGSGPNGFDFGGGFTLDDDADPALPDRMTFTGLTPDNPFVLTASAAQPLLLTAIVCDDAGNAPFASGDLTTATATVFVDAGEAVTCTFQYAVGALVTLVKNVVNDDAGTAVATDFLLMLDGQLVLTGQTTLVPAGVPLTLAEVGRVGYTLTGITGDPGCPATNGGTVTLAKSESITCTFTNDDVAGAPVGDALLRVRTDYTDPLGEGAGDQFTIELDAMPIATVVNPGPSGGAPVLLSDVQLGIAAGTHALAVSSADLLDYRVIFACVDNAQSPPAAVSVTMTGPGAWTFTAALGQDITCRFTLRFHRPDLTVEVTNDTGAQATGTVTLRDAGAAVLDSFSYDVADQATHTFASLQAGTYMLEVTQTSAAADFLQWTCLFAASGFSSTATVAVDLQHSASPDPFQLDDGECRLSLTNLP